MIDIENPKERDLKNIRQIGNPTEDDKIYIENAAYARIHEEDYAQKRVFIFMGHTECSQGKYATFVEAAIPVRDLEFSQNIPKWDNHAWSDIFREIKRSYENSIIVGWAMDIKGFSPCMTTELEHVHREQFGGAHQVLFLMDSVEGDECFYINKGNCLQQKEGFYIYYSRELRKMRTADVTVEFPKISRTKEVVQPQASVKAHYRESMQEKNASGSHRASSYAMTAAILLLLGIVGAGIWQDRIKLSGIEQVIETMSHQINSKQRNAEVLVGTQWNENTQNNQETQDATRETYTETLDLIPIENIPMGDVKKEDSESKENAQKSDTVDSEIEEKAKEKKQSKEKKKTEKTTKTNAQAKYYVVQEGDTLTAICQKQYGSTKKLADLAAANNMENSDEIRVGQKLLLP
mgnify:FL=1